MHARRHWIWLWGLYSILCVSALPVLAQTRLKASNVSALRTNPIGLANDFRLGLHTTLFKREGALWQDNHVGVQARLFATPAGVQPGAAIVFKPAAVLKLEAGYTFVTWFGNLGQFNALTDVATPASDADLDTVPDRAVTGYNLFVGATLAGKVGNIVLRNVVTYNFEQYRELRPGEEAFYDSILETVVPNRGQTFLNELDLLHFSNNNRLITGLRWRSLSSWTASGDRTRSQHGLGPVIAYKLAERDGASFKKRTLFLIPLWWLKHPYRSGTETSVWLPTLQVGFRFVPKWD